MKSIWRLAMNDLKLTLRDRASAFWLAIFPLALMWFFASVMGGGNPDNAPTTPSVTLTFENQDDGWLSEALVQELQHERVRLQSGDHADETDQDRVRTLVIPAGFTDGVLAGQQQTVELRKEPGSDAEFGMAAQVHIVRAIVRTLSRTIELTSGDDPSAGAQPMLERYQALVERPELITLDVSFAGRGNPVPSGAAQSVPGIMTMTVLMMTMIYGAVFLTLEKSSGMLRRQGTAPVGKFQIFSGKLLGRVLIAAVQIVLFVAAGQFLFGLSWGNSPLGLLLLLIGFAVSVAGISTYLGAILSTPAQASAVGWIAAMVLAALGGCWWPIEVAPAWMQKLALVLPTGWAMKGFHSLISFGRGIESVLLPSAVLTAFGLLFAVLGARTLKLD